MMEDPHNKDFVPDISQLRKVLKDPQVLNLLLQELQTLPKDVFEVSVAFEKINVVIYPDTYRQHLHKETAKKHSHHSTQTESKYVIRISKSFPLRNSLRVHLLDGAVQPRLCDCRDFFQDIMGVQYAYPTHFLDLLQGLIKFDHKLHMANQQYMEMQRYGHFILGQSYFYHQLAEIFRSLTLLKDHSQKKSNIYVGVTETHLLIFKELTQKQGSMGHMRLHHSLVAKSQYEIQQEIQATHFKLRLISHLEMQCIDTIYYKQSEKVIRLLIKKYKSIKLYHQSQDIKKQYRFSKPEVFLRGVLKVITRFQPCEIDFQPVFAEKKKERRSSVVERGDEDVAAMIASAESLEQELKNDVKGDNKAKISMINKLYQKIIEHYSARANPYYLIFVNKLNLFYQKHYLSSK